MQQTIFVTLNVVICEPTFFKKHDDHPKGVWKKKLVWKDEWVKEWKTEKQASVVQKKVKVIKSLAENVEVQNFPHT